MEKQERALRRLQVVGAVVAGLAGPVWAFGPHVAAIAIFVLGVGLMIPAPRRKVRSARLPRIHARQRGQGMVEYALILVLIAVVVIAMLTVVGNRANTAFCNVANGLGAGNACSGGGGGATLELVGSGFTGATAVSFGGATATYTVVSDTEITATIPSGVSGVVTVQVTTAGGSTDLVGPYASTGCPVPTSEPKPINDHWTGLVTPCTETAVGVSSVFPVTVWGSAPAGTAVTLTYSDTCWSCDGPPVYVDNWQATDNSGASQSAASARTQTTVASDGTMNFAPPASPYNSIRVSIVGLPDANNGQDLYVNEP